MNEVLIVLASAFSIYIVGVIILKVQKHENVIDEKLLFHASWLLSACLAIFTATSIYSNHLDIAFALTPLAILFGSLMIGASIMKALASREK
jgi:hypothetical protein